MNRKAFTLIELLAIIIILGILGSLATTAYYKHVKTAREESFEMAEKTFINNVKDAYADCLSNSSNGFCQKYSRPQKNNETETVYLSDLIEYDYSENIKDPYGNCDNFDGSSSVVVTLKRKAKTNDATGEPYTESEIPTDQRNYECDYDLTLTTSKYYYCEYEYTVCFKCSSTASCEQH